MTVSFVAKRLLVMIPKFLGIVLASLLIVVAALATVGYLRDRAPKGAPMGEQPSPDEPNYTTEIIQSAIDNSVHARQHLINNWNKPGFTRPSSEKASPGFSPYHYTRDAHAKGSGCVLATFTVNKEIDERFNYGVFSKPADKPETEVSYNAIIRFSNGNPSIQSDSARDPRGFAIKLRGVDGDKLLPTEKDDKTQDFIMMNSPVFFIRTLQDYALFNHLLTTVEPGQLPIIRAYFLAPWWQPWNWHARELRLALKAGGARPASLVTTRYYSASAYALGPRQFVKYSAIPCRDNKPMPPAGAADSPDYLRLELANQSHQGGACFDFAVQPQVIGKNMPVEDTTVEWSEKDSPFVPLARITIKAADNNTEAMNQQCENTAFNPWHSLPDHRPVGVMNRVRMSLYDAMSRFRQTHNCSADHCDPMKCNSQDWPDNGATTACETAPTN